MYYDTMETGKRIQTLRKQEKLMQEQLAEKLNISVRHLQKLETGERGGSVDTLVEVSSVFHVSLDFLILGKPEPEMVKSQLQKLADCIEKATKIL